MKRKLIKPLFLVVLVCGFMLSACSLTSNNETLETCDKETMEGYTKHEDEDENFQFQYPSDWTLDTETSGVYLTATSPLESEEDFLQEGMNIVIEDLTEEEASGDLDEAVDYAIDELKEEMDNFNLIEKEDTKLSGLKAKRIHYTWEIEDIKVDMVQIIAVSTQREKEYVLTFSNFEEGDAQDKWNDIYDEILDSFCFTPAEEE